MVTLEKKTYKNVTYWIHDPLNNTSEKLKNIPSKITPQISLLYLMKQNGMHSPILLISSTKDPCKFCQP